MYLQLVCVGIICLIGWLYLRWRRIKTYWSDRGVPNVPPVPLLGSFGFLVKENFGVWLRRMNLQFKSPYIGIWTFWRPGIIINSPEIARNILIKDFDNFRNRLVSSGVTDPIGGLNLFTVKEPIWSAVRQQLSGVFTASKLRMLQYNIRIKSQELVQRIHNDRDIKIDLKKMFVDYTTDVIGTSAFGIKSDATLTGGGPLRDVTKDFSKYDMYRNLSWYSIYFVPELVDIFRFKFFPKSATDYFRKIFRSVALQRKTNQTDEKARDLLDFLLKVQKENESYSDDLIIAQAAIFLLAGYESCATLLTYTTYELAHLPDLQDKVYQELSEAAKCSEEGELDVEVLSELTYLNCVIKEGLRKYITLTWLDRITIKDYKIDDKVTLESGTAVFINVIGMQYDPQYFPEPNKFDPDRFLPENKNNIELYSYLPFGEGPKFCIGKKFGLMTAEFALASILLNYKIQPYPNTPRPEDIKIDNRGILYLPADTLHVSFVPRK
ncbi:unnamed protein product [Euphydryas editha]|uniref:unspecific monooxygenase n=1 Tax=Euphydryas editha TaxID=104508 RepID=A0AAU9TJL6_EUPED|nr:unnamed protein product [Euphydryas editha]